MTRQHAPAGSDGESTDPVIALLDACQHFAIHVSLLADQLADAELS